MVWKPPVASHVELQRSLAGRQAQQCISELVVSKHPIAVLIGIPCSTENTQFTSTKNCTAVFC